MDNSRYYNDSLAYDFERFMPHEDRKKAEIVKMPARKKKSVSNKTASVMSEKIKKVAIIGFVLSLVCANIFLRASITEVNSHINEIKTEINELSAEETRLNVEFENRISYKNIESEAASLGMMKMDKSQVVYIKTNDKNAAVTSNGNLSAAKD